MTIEIDKCALIEASLAVNQSSAYSGPGAKGTASAPGYCCGICQGIFTDDLPEMMTACCGRLVHDLCHYDALDDNKPCWSCNDEQRAANQTQSTEVLEHSSYIVRFAAQPELKPGRTGTDFVAGSYH